MGNTTGKILLVDDDRVFRIAVKTLLTDDGHRVVAAENGRIALEKFKETDFDLVLSDLKMEGISGIELTQKILRTNPNTIIIMVTGYASIDSAVEVMKIGAYDYITKPCNNNELKLRINRALEKRKTDFENQLLKEEVKEKYNFGNIIGKNKKMRELFDVIAQVAETDATVMILGETGTGKELVAKAIHYNSHRKENPFVAINCAALPDTLLESELFGHEKGAFTGAVKTKKGKFEFADGGTLFLDEIGDIPLSTQAKLLRVLQEREFEKLGSNARIKTNLRIICATNKDLRELIDQGAFREDLYYRLNVVPIVLPSLRERQEDIPLLAMHFLKKYGEAINKNIEKISQDVMNHMLVYPWPGNVRELENFIERAVVMARGNYITHADLSLRGKKDHETGDGIDLVSPELPLKILLKQISENVEKEYIKLVLDKFNGSIGKSCNHAQISRRSLFEKMKQYNIRKEDYKN